MTEKVEAPANVDEKDALGNTVHRDDKGNIIKIVSPRGKEYTPRNLTAQADAETIRRVENFRWANEMTVAEFLLTAVKKFLDDEGQR